MTAEKQDAPKMISTPTILVLVAAVGLLGYLFIQPMLAPKEPAPAAGAKSATTQSAPIAAANQGNIAPPASNTAVEQGQSPAIGLEEVAAGDASERDPFLPSALLLAKLAAQNTQNVPVPEVTPAEPKVDTAPQFQPKVEQKPEAEKSPETGIVWRGIVGSGDSQLVMIQRNNRTYNLNVGETLPGTQYILAEVNKDSILLVSPTEQKRLYRKKEAK